MGQVRIENDYYRTPEYIKFAKTVRSRYMEFIIAHVARESEDIKKYSHGGHYIYKNHFLEGELVARFSQEDMAKYFTTSQSNMSRELTKLEKEGFIKKIPRYTKKAKILYYQVGTWSGKYGVKKGPNKYQDHLWFDVIFGAYAEVAKQKRNEEKHHEFQSLQEMMSDVEYDETCEGPFGNGT